MKASWPKVGGADHTLTQEAEYLNEIVHEFRVRIKKFSDKVKYTVMIVLFMNQTS